MTVPLEIAWTYAGELDDELVRAVLEGLEAGVGSAVGDLGLPDVPATAARRPAPDGSQAPLAFAGRNIRWAYPEWQAFGLVVGSDEAVPAAWSDRWAALAELGRPAVRDFAMYWGRLTVGSEPDLLFPAFEPHLVTTTSPAALPIMRQLFGYVLSSTVYRVDDWGAASAALEQETLQEALAASTSLFSRMPTLVELRSDRATASHVAAMLHGPRGPVAAFVRECFGSTRGCLVPNLAVVVDPTVPPGWVMARVGGRTLDAFPLPPLDHDVAIADDAMLHRPRWPDSPLAVSAVLADKEGYLAYAIIDLVVWHGSRLLSCRSVGVLLGLLAETWDPDLVQVLREDFSDEGVTVALRRLLPDDEQLHTLPVVLRELADTDGEVVDRINSALEAAKRRLEAFAHTSPTPSTVARTQA